MTHYESSLPTDHAFVVQFRAQTGVTPLRCEGRVEHVVSGHATHFASWEQLVRFIEQILTAVWEKPP